MKINRTGSINSHNSLTAYLVCQTTFEWKPGTTVIIAPISFFRLFQRVITGIVPRTFRRYFNTSGSPELAIYRLVETVTGHTS